MKEENAQPPNTFGCTCGSEKVIFCYDKRARQGTWSCSGYCFKGTKNNYPTLTRSVEMASHCAAVQTEDKFERPSISNSIAIETELSGVASSERLTSLFTSALEVLKKAEENYIPSTSKQYVSSGGVICVSGVDDDDLEPVPIVDKPEGVSYEKEQDGTACEEVGEQAINDDSGDNDDDAGETRATSEGLFTCSHCGRVFKKEGFLARHQKTHQKEMENEKTKGEKKEGRKGRNKIDDDDGGDSNDDDDGGDVSGDDNDYEYTVENDEDRDDDDEEVVNESFFKCHQCDKAFKKKRFLARHKKAHLEEREQDHNYEDKDDKYVDDKSKSNNYSQSNDKKACSTKKKHDQRSLKCGSCKKRFINKRNYERHVKTHTTPKPLKCKNCQRVFKSEKSLCNHQKKHTEEELKCVFCIKVVHSRYDFERHLLTHPRQKSFKCTMCFKELKSAHVFAKHLAKHKELKCDDCGKVCKNEKRFISHREIHENPKSLEQEVLEVEYRECFYCDMICKPSEFRSHVRTHAKKRKSQGPLECTYCGKLSDSRVSHDRHLRTHTKEKPFKCTFEDCSKTFAGKGELRVHLRRHTGDKRFKCERCEKTFVKKWNLDEHLRTHTGARPYKCEFCEKSFGFKNVLKVHLAQHTGEKPFKCPHCENRYVKRVLLNMHLVTHTGEKPFKCLQCDKAFVYSSGLREHVRMHTLNG